MDISTYPDWESRMLRFKLLVCLFVIVEKEDKKAGSMLVRY